MKTAGIVVEYNPFHNGHKYQIEKTRSQSGAECIVVVMSGNYVQRGEPAIFSKHERARAAVMGGADLVIELPSYFSLKSAEGFADGAVSLLHEIGCRIIGFGAETENINEIERAAECLLYENLEFKKTIKEILKKGLSFAAARELAARHAFGFDAEILRKPNNILAVEYIKAIKRHGFSIRPLAIKRIGAEHDSKTAYRKYASASHIRSLILSGGDYSKYTDFKTSEKPVSIDDFEEIILYSVKTGEFSGIADVSDGLHQKIKSSRAYSLEDLIGDIKTKRHALSRIKRVLMNILIGNNLPDNKRPSYIRVLAANAKGRKILAEKRENCSLPIITKPAAYKEDDDIWMLEKRATDIRNIVTKGLPEEKTSPMIL